MRDVRWLSYVTGIQKAFDDGRQKLFCVVGMKSLRVSTEVVGIALARNGNNLCFSGPTFDRYSNIELRSCAHKDYDVLVSSYQRRFDRLYGIGRYGLPHSLGVVSGKRCFFCEEP